MDQKSRRRERLHWVPALALALACGVVLPPTISSAAPKELSAADVLRVQSYRPAREDPPPTNAKSDHPMFTDPSLPELGLQDTFNPKLVGLWSAALHRPEIELRRKAAVTIGQAHALGMEGLEVFKAPLTEMLRAPEVSVQLAAAGALVEMNDPTAGPALLPLAQQGDSEVALVIDPALAAWQTAGAADMFRARLTASGSSPQLVLSAVEQLGTMRVAPAGDALLAISLDDRSDASLRLAAARAGALIDGGRQDDLLLAAARKLLPREEKKLNHLLAATLLSRSSGTEVQTTLLDLCGDPEATAVGVAAGRLLAIDPNLLVPVDEILLASSDNTVRATGVQACIAQHTSASGQLLIGAIKDISLGVRTAARVGLEKFDQDADLQAVIRPLLLEVISGRDWRAVEQAERFMGAVGEVKAAAQCVVLLRHARAEVRIAAIIALRKLAVPETIAELRERAEEVHRLGLLPRPKPEDIYRFVARPQPVLPKNSKIKLAPPAPPLDRSKFMPNAIALSGDIELAQLLETLGAMHDKKSEPLMRTLIPKGVPFELARQGAIWGLAKLHQGKEVPTLTGALLDRIQDNSPTNPESSDVQYMCVVALGIMHADGAKGTLEAMTGNGVSPGIGLAAMWAQDQISGQPFVVPPKPPHEVTGWFIEPWR